MSTKHLSDFTQALPRPDTAWVWQLRALTRGLVTMATLGFGAGCPGEPAANQPTTAAANDQGAGPALSVPARLSVDQALDAGEPWTPSPPVPSSTPDFIEAQFLDTYRLFVPRDFTGQEKAIRWSRYYQGRWVRWTGQLRFVTADALLFHHLGTTSSYEVSLQVPEPERSRLRQVLQLGRFYNYVGRMLRYETTFRVIVLEQGSVLAPNDTGVPGTLSTLPWTREPPPLPGLLPSSRSK